METQGETAEARLKRLRMRSWRRGMREVDLLLGPFADAELGGLTPGELEDFESLLLENDQDLYLWLSRTSGQPARLDEIVRRISAFHGLP